MNKLQAKTLLRELGIAGNVVSVRGNFRHGGRRIKVSTQDPSSSWLAYSRFAASIGQSPDDPRVFRDWQNLPAAERARFSGPAKRRAEIDVKREDYCQVCPKKRTK